MYKIVVDKHFERAYKKQPENVKKSFKDLIGIIKENPFDSTLKTHMLQGNKSHIFSLSVTYKIRALFINDVEREKWKSNLLHFRAEELKRIKYLGACSELHEQSEFSLGIPRQLAARILYY